MAQYIVRTDNDYEKEIFTTVALMNTERGQVTRIGVRRIFGFISALRKFGVSNRLSPFSYPPGKKESSLCSWAALKTFREIPGNRGEKHTKNLL